MTIDNNLSLYNSYDLFQKKQDNNQQSSGQNQSAKLANNALAHFQVDDVQIKSINGDKMEEAMSGLRNITMSLKEILNRNLQSSNKSEYTPSEIKSELLKSDDVSKLHNFDMLSSKVNSLLA